MNTIKICLLIAVAAGAVATIFVLAGVFNVAADVPHSALVLRVMELVRDRSIAVRARDVEMPWLNDPMRVADGADDYAAMCADCHRAPGVEESELRQGLYPKPPELTRRMHATPAEAFWIIKHGIKMSAMPAWGITHDDNSIWELVAFLQKLPELTPDQYQALVNPKGQAEHQHSHGHQGAGEQRHE